MAEIQADKDQLRAEFAMSTRRLEMSVEQLRAKTTTQLAEIGKKSDAIGRLKLELGEKSASLRALEAKEKEFADELHSGRADLATKGGAMAELERALASTRSELAQTTTDFQEASFAASNQRVELVAVRAQAEALKGQIERFEMETQDLQKRLHNKTAEVQLLSDMLSEERSKSDQFNTRIGELDRQLIAQMTESELLVRRVAELTARLDEQGRFLADSEYDADRLRNEVSSAQKSEADIRAALAEAENRHRAHSAPSSRSG